MRLHKLFYEEKFADCCFNVKNTRIYAHRIILASASPVFEAMFFGTFAAAISKGQSQHQEPRDETVLIVDVSAKIFRTVLEYVYTDETNWDAYDLYDLLELHYCAEKYLLRDLVVKTCARIHKTLNCNNLFLAYDFALRFEIKSLLGECRRMVQELLERKPNLFFKKVLQVNCDRAVEIESDNSSPDEDHRPAIKRKPPVPIEYIEDLVFSSTTSSDQEDSWQYHHVSKECVNDLLLLNFNDCDGTFNENLLLFVLKWTNIEWRLHAKGDERLPLQKLGLLKFFESFVCHKRSLPLVENLIAFLESHCYLSSVQRVPQLGWHLLQRVGLKASRPLTISGESFCFVTHFQVNQLLAIKSFIINSRLNNDVTSRAFRFNRQFLYKDNLIMEIFVSETSGDRSIHRQKFNVESEFNSQCELFLNKCLFFHPDQIYGLRLIWPQESALIREYPRKIFERCHNMALKDQPLSVIFMDDVNSNSTNKDSELTSGGIVQGMHFMFVS